MFEIIAKLHDIADSLDDQGKDELADHVDKIASFIFEAYKYRIHRQKKSRGRTRLRRKLYYKRHKPYTKRKQKIYRKRFHNQLKRRKRLKHFHRIF
jgi:hypothetical protein